MALIFLVGTIVLRMWPTSVYAITPGNATYVAPLISVSGLATSTHRSHIDLVDVYLERLNELQYLVDKATSHHIEYVPQSELISPGVSPSELENQGYLQMSDSQFYASMSALRALGWHIRTEADGTVVTEVVTGSPADQVGLHVGDLITSLNGHPVTSSCSLVGGLAGKPVGTRVVVGVAPANFSSAGVLRHGAIEHLALTTGSLPAGSVFSGCPHVGATTSYLGVALEDGYRANLPGVISVDTANIGGPSAGLAMTLSIIDALSKSPIAGKIPIAATGTIDLHGRVGDVGGVAEKTVAVAASGARYFFVPEVEASVAKRAAPRRLHIVGVTSLSQVLTTLRSLGEPAPVAITRPSNTKK